MDLPSSPTAEQLQQIQQYLDFHRKTAKGNQYGKRGTYKDKTEVVGKKVIIFKHSQKKNDYWYMRMYVGDKKYKQVSYKKFTDMHNKAFRGFKYIGMK